MQAILKRLVGYAIIEVRGYTPPGAGFFIAMNPSLMNQLTQGMQQGGSPMNVQTPGAPTYQPSLTPPQPSPMPNKSPESAMHLGALHRFYERNNMQKPAQLSQGAPIAQPSAQPQAGGQAQPQVPISEAELIIKALARRLEHHSKTAEKIVNAMIPAENTQS